MCDRQLKVSGNIRFVASPPRKFRALFTNSPMLHGPFPVVIRSPDVDLFNKKGLIFHDILNID